MKCGSMQSAKMLSNRAFSRKVKRTKKRGMGGWPAKGSLSFPQGWLIGLEAPGDGHEKSLLAKMSLGCIGGQEAHGDRRPNSRAVV